MDVLSGIKDNHKRGNVGDFLREKIQSGSKLSFVSAYFTIYAYDMMRAHLESADSLRFLFGEPRFVRNIDPDKTDKKAFDKTEPYQELCDLFDKETGHGQDMAKYDDLLGKAVKSIAGTFKKRIAVGLTAGRDFVIPDQHEQAKDDDDFELITWLIIK